MLSYFPARDVQEPVTREHLSTEFAALRFGIRAELHDGSNGFGGEMAGLREDLRGDRRRQFCWQMGATLTMIASMVAVLVAVLIAVV